MAMSTWKGVPSSRALSWVPSSSTLGPCPLENAEPVPKAPPWVGNSEGKGQSICGSPRFVSPKSNPLWMQGPGRPAHSPIGTAGASLNLGLHLILSLYEGGICSFLILVVSPKQPGGYPAIWRCFGLPWGARFWIEAVWSGLSVYREDARAKRKALSEFAFSSCGKHKNTKGIVDLQVRVHHHEKPRQELKQRPKRNTAHWLAQPAFL